MTKTELKNQILDQLTNSERKIFVGDVKEDLVGFVEDLLTKNSYRLTENKKDSCSTHEYNFHLCDDNCSALKFNTRFLTFIKND